MTGEQAKREFSRRLAALMERRGLTPLGVSLLVYGETSHAQAVRMWLGGQSSPTLVTLCRLRRALNCTYDELLP